MQSDVLHMIEMLKHALSDTARELRSKDKEESKELAPFKRRVAFLRDTLHRIVDRVLRTVEERLKGYLSPFCY